MAKTELTSLQKRILTSLIMIPIVIGALQSGHPYVDILVFIVRRNALLGMGFNGTQQEIKRLCRMLYFCNGVFPVGI